MAHLGPGFLVTRFTVKFGKISMIISLLFLLTFQIYSELGDDHIVVVV